MAKTGEGERIIKLMLFVRENQPVDYASIRKGLPFEYGPETGADETVRRRFERDKRSLQEFGVFFNNDPDNRYSLDETRSYAAPVDLTKPQASLLRLLCGALLEDEDYPFKDELRMVLIKLGDELGVPDLLPQMENPSFETLGHTSEPQGLEKARKAISARKRLLFEYRGSGDKISSREVEPFGCFILKSRCYVVAFDPMVDAERSFRLDRMNHIRVNRTDPGIPDFNERPFVVDRYYGLPFQFGTENYTARVQFDAAEAWRCEQLAMGQGTLQDEDGAIVWSVECRDTQELARWCIEHAPGIRLLDPPEAVHALRRGIDAARKVLEKTGAEAAS
jgi:predicted DNA-binding transcriptional regulator YafY